MTTYYGFLVRRIGATIHTTEDYEKSFFSERGDCVTRHRFIFETSEKAEGFMLNLKVLMGDENYRTFIANLEEVKNGETFIRFKADDRSVEVLMPAFGDERKSRIWGEDYFYRIIRDALISLFKDRVFKGAFSEGEEGRVLSVDIHVTYDRDYPKSVLKDFGMDPYEYMYKEVA
jgi:hypothetical protein